MIKYLLAGIISIASFTASWPTLASDSTYFIDTNKLAISKESFNRQVKPLLKNILEENEKIQKIVTPDNAALRQLRDIMANDQKNWQTTPPSGYQKAISEFENQIQNSGIKIHQKIQLWQLLDDLRLNDQRIHHGIQSLKHAPQKSDQNLINNYFNNCQLFIDLAELSTIDKDLRRDFELFWSFFIKKLKDFHDETTPYSVFPQKIESLNMTWNYFNLKMTKSALTPPSEIKINLQNIQNHWNWIMRMYFNRAQNIYLDSKDALKNEEGKKFPSSH